MKQNGFSLIELIISVIFVIILSMGIFGFFANNKGATEERAYEAMDSFIIKNGIETKRKSCAGDSDGDGYASCTVVATDGEKIHLQCPSNWGDTTVWGASGCKEVDIRIQQPLRSAIPLEQR